MAEKVVILPRREVQRISPLDRNYAVFEMEEDGSWRQISKGYPHSTSCYAKLGRITAAESRAVEPSDFEKSVDAMIQAHCLAADKRDAEFYNLGWAQGDDFIESKTSQGRLYTSRNADGSYSHTWRS